VLEAVIVAARDLITATPPAVLLAVTVPDVPVTITDPAVLRTFTIAPAGAITSKSAEHPLMTPSSGQLAVMVTLPPDAAVVTSGPQNA
jgi:hypothetical protein